MAGISSSESDPDVLMVDPFLDYINAILMEEGVDDACATSIQQFDSPSYQAILSGFYNILDEHSTPDSASHDAAFDQQPLHGQSMFCSHENIGREEHHAQVANLNVGLTDELHDINVGADPGVSLPADGRLHQEKPLKASELGEKKNDSRYDSCSREEITADEAKLSQVNLLFEVDDVYTSLYVEEPSSSTLRAAENSKHNIIGGKKKPSAGEGSKLGKGRTSEVQVFVDVRELLMKCAQAVATGDMRRAEQMLQEIHQVHGASANGTGLQRIAHIFSTALAMRMRGVFGEHEFTAMASTSTSLRALITACKVTPFVKVKHYFANQSILKAAEGASRLHVVDYGILYGTQWPCLISALADRKGGPPLLVITGIASSQPGVNAGESLEECGRRLAAYAKTVNVPFQYHAIVSNKWEELDAASLHCRQDEVLVLNCLKCLRHLADDSAESVSTTSCRQKFLNYMHSLNPQLLVVAVVNAALNPPFFLSRFREALYHYSNKFDMLESLWGDTPERLTLERVYFYRDIVNVVACEGAKRFERPETYWQWHARIAKVGFEQVPIPTTILCKSKAHMKQHYHKDCLVDYDANGWMLMGWKGRTTLAFSTWKPCHRVEQWGVSGGGTRRGLDRASKRSSLGEAVD